MYMRVHEHSQECGEVYTCNFAAHSSFALVHILYLYHAASPHHMLRALCSSLASSSFFVFVYIFAYCHAVLRLLMLPACLRIISVWVLVLFLPFHFVFCICNICATKQKIAMQKSTKKANTAPHLYKNCVWQWKRLNIGFHTPTHTCELFVAFCRFLKIVFTAFFSVLLLAHMHELVLFLRILTICALSFVCEQTSQAWHRGRREAHSDASWRWQWGMATWTLWQLLLLPRLGQVFKGTRVQYAIALLMTDRRAGAVDGWAAAVSRKLCEECDYAYDATGALSTRLMRSVTLAN